MIHFDLLIIDDEPRFGDYLARRLNLRGLTCCVCHEGLSGLDILSRKKFKLILLDLQLPDIYGTKVLACIKKICPTTPVVILTGHGSEKDPSEIRSGENTKDLVSLSVPAIGNTWQLLTKTCKRG